MGYIISEKTESDSILAVKSTLEVLKIEQVDKFMFVCPPFDIMLILVGEIWLENHLVSAFLK